MPKALISTLTPVSGGVPQMAAFIGSLLKQEDFEVGFAHYQPYRLSPQLSVPLHELPRRRVSRKYGTYRGCPAYAVGAWLPELEFTHYLPTRQWRELLDQYDVHLSVSGNCLAATPYAMCAMPFWSWVATDWAEDRVQRAGAFPWYRKILDRLVNTVVARRLEKAILASGGTIVALSQHTKTVLRGLTTAPVNIEVMPMGIDTDKFTKTPGRASGPPTIGFVGRLDDPRKNIDLLLQALVRLRLKGIRFSAMLVGEGGQKALRPEVEARGLAEAVAIIDYVDNGKLPELLSRLDVFVIPSHQEGLCIAALEAMSCGVPVVSTRCGGPEEFVEEGKTGYFFDANPQSLADAVAMVISDMELCSKLGRNSRLLVENRYSVHRVRGLFWYSFGQTFPGFI